MTLEELLRWEDSGAGWRVVGRGASDVTLVLLSCDGGEEMDRVISDDPGVLDHIGPRESSY